jgi:sugar O-acyltransferase (sialic acid O-acetyltransferase NeuD family)
MPSLVILGTGGNAHDVLDIVEAINAVAPTWRVAGFLEDSIPIGVSKLGHKVLGRLCDARGFEDVWFLNAIGSDRSYGRRPELVARTGLRPERFATLIHPGASVSSRARLGRGVYVSFGVSVAGGVTVGDHASFGACCVVGHDTVIEDFVVLAPGATVSGFVRLGRGCYVGARAAIRQEVRIGDGALVGLGAVVTRDVSAGTTVVGNPARPLVRQGGRPVGNTRANGTALAGE